MFYMKHKGKKLEIHEDNVYTICPQCGKEHAVDLQDILKCEHADLYSTYPYCEECTAQRERDRAAGKHVPWPSRQKSAETDNKKRTARRRPRG